MEAVVKPGMAVQELGKKQFDDYVNKTIDQKTDPSLGEKQHSTA